MQGKVTVYRKAEIEVFILKQYKIIGMISASSN
jgi:hypothetical protein